MSLRRIVRVGWVACLCIALAACDGAAAPAPPTPPVAQSSNAPTTQSTNKPTIAPSAVPTLAPTATLRPTPTPAPTLKQLTDGKCCTQPFWSADAKQVLFIDKPDAKAPTGIYAVDVAAPTAPKLFTERIAFYTSDMQYTQSLDATFTTIERVSDGQKWKIRTGGRTVLLSPDRTRVVWSETPQTNAPFETRVTTVMGANFDGSDARPITQLLRGGVTAWLDNQRLLLTARQNRNSQEVTLYVYSLADGSTTELAKSERLRSAFPSPTGEWVLYSINFDQNAEQSGLWLIHPDGSARKKLDFFGAYQWRDGHRLIYVPLELDQPSHVFWEYDANTGARRPLTNPALTPFKIANGDWVLSPDGTKIVFLNAADLNLWLWELVK